MRTKATAAQVPNTVAGVADNAARERGELAACAGGGRDDEELAFDPACADVLQQLRGYIEQRWDFERLTVDILESQRRRNLIMRAVSLGRTPAWDFQPFEDATRMYYRGGGNWHEAEERDFLRF